LPKHSPQAYFIIKTIHLRNLAKPDTLAATMRIQRPEAAGAWGVLVRFHSADSKIKFDDVQFRSVPQAGKPLWNRQRGHAGCDSSFCEKGYEAKLVR
jgi:hypothetical protein